MLSIFYILIFLYYGEIPFLDLRLEKEEQKKKFINHKINSEPMETCVRYNLVCLSEFAKEIYGLEFKEKPNYRKLKFLLTKPLLEMNIVPSLQFDWNSEEFFDNLLFSSFRENDYENKI